MHRVLPGPKYPRVLLYRNRTIVSSSRLTLRVASFSTKMSHNAPVPRDVREFLDGYPYARDELDLNANFEFYSNTRRCRPDNLLIEDLLEQ